MTSNEVSSKLKSSEPPREVDFSQSQIDRISHHVTPHKYVIQCDIKLRFSAHNKSLKLHYKRVRAGFVAEKYHITGYLTKCDMV